MLLITGITGRSGKYLLKYIIKNEKKFPFKEITLLVREPSKVNTPENISISFNVVKGNLNDEKSLNHLMKNVNTVLHIASIHYSTNIVSAAIKNDVKKIILVHTTGIFSKYKSANFEYKNIEKNISKLQQKYNLDISIIRPTMIFGSLDDNNMSVFIKLIDKFKLIPVVNKGEFLLQPVHQADLASAYYLMLLNIDKTINKNYVISGKEPIFLIDVLKIISKFLGVKRKFLSIPFSFAYLVSFIIYLVTFTKIDYREKVQRLIEDRAFEHNDVKKDFGYDPLDFETRIKQEIELYLSKK